GFYCAADIERRGDDHADILAETPMGPAQHFFRQFGGSDEYFAAFFFPWDGTQAQESVGTDTIEQTAVGRVFQQVDEGQVIMFGDGTVERLITDMTFADENIA